MQKAESLSFPWVLEATKYFYKIGHRRTRKMSCLRVFDPPRLAPYRQGEEGEVLQPSALFLLPLLLPLLTSSSSGITDRAGSGISSSSNIITSAVEQCCCCCSYSTTCCCCWHSFNRDHFAHPDTPAAVCSQQHSGRMGITLTGERRNEKPAGGCWLLVMVLRSRTIHSPVTCWRLATKKCGRNHVVWDLCCYYDKAFMPKMMMTSATKVNTNKWASNAMSSIVNESKSLDATSCAMQSNTKSNSLGRESLANPGHVCHSCAKNFLDVVLPL